MKDRTTGYDPKLFWEMRGDKVVKKMERDYEESFRSLEGKGRKEPPSWKFIKGGGGALMKKVEANETEE